MPNKGAKNMRRKEDKAEKSVSLTSLSVDAQTCEFVGAKSMRRKGERAEKSVSLTSLSVDAQT